MDLRLFFDSVQDQIGGFDSEIASLGTHIFNNFSQIPRWKDVDIAIIGINEQRGSKNNHCQSNSADQVRKKLYALKKSKTPVIVDLGNLRIGENLEQTYLRLSEVLENLMVQNIVPVIIGASHDLQIGQYWAYQAMEKLVYLLNIDHCIDLGEEQNPSKNHLHQIFTHEPNYLFSFGQIAYQTYLTDAEKIEIFRKLNFDLVSVGEFRNQPKNIEALIRSADLIGFDVSAIKKNDAMGNANASPFGLTAEEACQMAWYAGMSNKLSSFGIYEYNADFDDKGHTASVLATMIWYFIEGFGYRQKGFELKNNFHIKYIVPFLDMNYQLIFYKSALTEQWWLEIPEDLNVYTQKKLIPCSYSDYQEASQGNLPDCWVKAMSRDL
ncbi:MAG: formiminoglutamase [Bacteroidetes bacterium]|nr:MAG: formiminoglutamase [Bacteroidota bacterium]